MGDAISHGILPGIVLAFLLSGTRHPMWILLGASAFGLLTVWIAQWMEKKINLQNDASIGLSFTFLFAIGVILISAYAYEVDLDQACVLYGEMAYLPLDIWIWQGKNMGPRALYILSMMNIIVIIFLFIAYRRMLISTFDAAYASTIGIATLLWKQLLMSVVSMTLVASFEVVGAILVVAFLTAPAATAYLVSKSVKQMMFFACLFGVLSVGIGYVAVRYIIEGSLAGAMASAAGIIFALTLLAKKIRFSPTPKKKAPLPTQTEAPPPIIQ